MMRSKPRKEDLNVNIMLQSGITTRDDKGKQPEESAWVCKVPMKEPKFDLESTKETFMETKSFMEASTSGSKDKLGPEIDLSLLTTFLETCMKLLHDSKVVKGLQELITWCARSGEPHVVWKLENYTSRTRREMRFTAQSESMKWIELFYI